LKVGRIRAAGLRRRDGGVDLGDLGGACERLSDAAARMWSRALAYWGSSQVRGGEVEAVDAHTLQKM
jgi:hypothetical protein